MSMTNVFRRAGLLLACLLLGGALSVALGQDANWDLRNYHLYNAWALLTGRWGLDMYAAGIQTYFNPLLDIPYYHAAFIHLVDRPRVVAFLMGLPFGLLAFATASIARSAVQDLPLRSPRPLLLAFCAAIFGLSGAATVSQLGTTFNEIQVAALVLLGVMCLLRALSGEADTRGRGLGFVLLGGLLFGLAAGAKLTAAVYAPAAVLGLFRARRGWRAGLVRGVAFSAAWSAGFALTYGWWGLFLYRQTGNPVFPFFESFFRSGMVPPVSAREMRFMPETTLEVLFYPFHWMDDSTLTVADVAFKDPRFAVAYGALILAGLGLLATRLRGRADAVRPRVLLTARLRFLLIFCGSAFLVWMGLFSILRYLVPVEALLGVLLLVAVAVPLARATGRPASGTGMVLLLVGAGVVSAAVTRYPEWGRLEHAPPTAELANVTLPPHSLVLAWAPPQAYAMPFIERANPGTRFLGVTGELVSARGYGLWTQWTARLRAHHGPVFIMLIDDELHWPEVLGELGFSLPREHCQKFSSRVSGELKLCPLVREGAAPG
ncbi:hypothetical protein APR48_07180 [Variovorax paradoxus]|nr:hypothetical protein APR49_06870 [Variovorax paradoxus]KPV34510.1 hypothetical protein APR48_07180 [Variovorax paradoxus]